MELVGSPSSNEFSDFADLASTLSSLPSPICVRTLVVEGKGHGYDSLRLWRDVLRWLDPIQFHFRTGDEQLDRAIPPSVHFVPSDFVEDSFAKYWSRLDSFGSSGPGSVLLVEGTKGTSPFEACLRRCSPDLPFLRADIWTETLEDVVEWEPIDKEYISRGLEELEIPAGAMKGVRLVLSMGEGGDDEEA